MRKIIHVNPPVDPVEPTRIEIEWHAPPRKSLAEKGRDLWKELFTSIDTLEQLANWESRIPSFECNCKRFYLSWKANNQPVEVNGQIPFEWKWSLKSAVNQKLGHADLTLEEARDYWSSQITLSDHQMQLRRCKEGESLSQAQ